MDPRQRPPLVHACRDEAHLMLGRREQAMEGARSEARSPAVPGTPHPSRPYSLEDEYTSWGERPQDPDRDPHRVGADDPVGTAPTRAAPPRARAHKGDIPNDPS